MSMTEQANDGSKVEIDFDKPLVSNFNEWRQAECLGRTNASDCHFVRLSNGAAMFIVPVDRYGVVPPVARAFGGWTDKPVVRNVTPPAEPDPHRPFPDDPGVRLWNVGKYVDVPYWGVYIAIDDVDAAGFWLSDDCGVTDLMTDGDRALAPKASPRRVWNPNHLKHLDDLREFVAKFRAKRDAAKQPDHSHGTLPAPAEAQGGGGEQPREGDMRWVEGRTQYGKFTLQQYRDGQWRDVPRVAGKAGE